MDGKGDQSHWSTVSFNICMLRIPGSLNSKYIQFDKSEVYIPPEAEVRIVKSWDAFYTYCRTRSINAVLYLSTICSN